MFSFSLIDLILTIVLVVVVILLLGNDTTRRKLRIGGSKGKGDQSVDQIQTKLAIHKQRIEEIAARMEELSDSNLYLRSQLESISSKLQQIEAKTDVKENKTDVSKSSQKPSHNSSRQETKPQVTTIKKYVQQLDSQGFENDNLLDNLTKFTKLVVDITGTKAKYTVPTSSDCQEKLINGYASISPFVEEISHSSSPTRIENVDPGTMELVGDHWEIKTKLKVKLV